ncbi:aldo/keto reductase [Microbispora triticiradicis]|uniref:Aldo/keto reductase n=3 Tax=Microbispora TaxID=2005 RepID=A0ABY3LZX3_9ACTN|nr:MULTISPECIES: aldo/keto reductase [Microbispora]RGA01348.1 aldo/keto reductase [Microbispora triticiradicis]TLP63947.1 aldo/keto reductase [Microbispora fusca]TYB60788.1 aldo/keto reductase [Microbispora tritici]GLW20210.1 aldo/keto reductase [Microbispora amethystogenes]
MEYGRLGTTGLKVSRLCLGMMSYGEPSKWGGWALEEDLAEPIVRRAAEGGVTFFDTADMYSAGVSEEVTGRLLRKIFARRDDYVLATKVYFPMGEGQNDGGLSRKHIMSAVDASLTRLGTDHVDLYQIHRWDDETPIEETMEALHDVVKAGKARYIGASSMRAWQFAKAQHTAERRGWTRFVSMQNHYNLLDREEEREMIPQCLDQGVGLIPWSPLARGLLARAGQAADTARQTGDGARQRQLYGGPAVEEILDRVARTAADRGVSPATVALAWLLGRPGVTAPIIGATKEHHVDDALAAVDLTLTEEEIAFLQEPYQARSPQY